MSNANKDEKNIWQQILLRTELRAISGTLRQIDALINNDDTTARQLADIILQDIGLTTRVLTIASSVQYQSSDSSSTGSTLIKAIVRIGFRGLRAICISTAILDNIAKKIPHQPELLSCIAQSFCVAVHSRNVARKTNADAEEAFIAGLMQNIGEMVFWCSSIPKSNQYRDLLNSGFGKSVV